MTRLRSRWTAGVASRHVGTVYVAWSVFQGAGNNAIYVARSTDHGATFTKPVKVSEGVQDNQFADIAVTRDGTVHVVWRRFAGRNQSDAVVLATSRDGGATFSKPRVLRGITAFDAADAPGDYIAQDQAARDAFRAADGPEAEEAPQPGGSRDCGSGPFACRSGFVFFRHASQPRATADPTAAGDGTLFVALDAVDPATVVPSSSSYSSAGPGNVGQGRIYLLTVSPSGTVSPLRAIDPQAAGHQFFPDINADGGVLHAVYHDSRHDDGYSVQNPPGNSSATDAYGAHLASSGIDTYAASSTDGGAHWTTSRLSSISQRPNDEMFGDRRVPFHGDYNYVASLGSQAYSVWTDTRQVVPGDDPRYQGGESFDVQQCRTANPDGSYGADSCPNAGGLDQDVFGAASSS